MSSTGTTWITDSNTQAGATKTYSSTELITTLRITGNEDGDSVLELFADEGTDNADKWKIWVDASDDDLRFSNYTSGSWVHKLTLTDSGNLTVTGTVTSGGGYVPWVTYSTWYESSSGGVDFIPLALFSDTETSNTNGTATRILMPYAGYLEKIIFRTSTGGDTVAFEIYKAASGTASADVDQTKLDDTVTVEDGTAHTGVTATFGTDYLFAVGDVMGIKMTYESRVDSVEMVIVWKVLAD